MGDAQLGDHTHKHSNWRTPDAHSQRRSAHALAIPLGKGSNSTAKWGSDKAVHIADCVTQAHHSHARGKSSRDNILMKTLSVLFLSLNYASCQFHAMPLAKLGASTQGASRKGGWVAFCRHNEILHTHRAAAPNKRKSHELKTSTFRGGGEGNSINALSFASPTERAILRQSKAVRDPSHHPVTAR